MKLLCFPTWRSNYTQVQVDCYGSGHGSALSWIVIWVSILFYLFYRRFSITSDDAVRWWKWCSGSSVIFLRSLSNKQYNWEKKHFLCCWNSILKIGSSSHPVAVYNDRNPLVCGIRCKTLTRDSRDDHCWFRTLIFK